jgi:hypothetical protein
VISPEGQLSRQPAAGRHHSKSTRRAQKPS